MNTIALQIERIKSKLQLLKSKDSNFECFGAESHHYILNPVKTVEELEHFEQKHHIQLPEGYKAFLTEIGNGGVGPYYGMASLEDGLKDSLNYADDATEISYNQLNLDFPHTREWNVDEAIWDKIELANEQGDDELEEALFDELWNKTNYSNPIHNQGIIYTSNFGCGVNLFLVVHGASYGQIWVDDRSNNNGIYPDHYFENKERLNFLDWYELWLDLSLK